MLKRRNEKFPGSPEVGAEERAALRREGEGVAEEGVLPHEAEEDALFAGIGMVDPYTGDPIETKADFLRWKERFLADTAAQSEAAEDVTLADSMERDFADQSVAGRMEQAIASELDRIRQWDSAVAALEDIAAADVFPAIYEKVMRGYSLSDAYYLANADRLQREAVTRAEDALRSRLESKEHLRTVKNRGGGEAHIPAEVMAEFQRILPEADVGAVRKFYRKDRGRVRRNGK